VIELHIHIEPLGTRDLLRHERLTILSGHLTLLRTRAERGILVSVEAISRAEKLARALVAEEMLT
jgi:hypothetical protein